MDTRGNLADKDRLQQIQPGVSTRDDVAAVLGTPSTMGTFDPNTWYYIGARTEKTAFFRPDTVERKVVNQVKVGKSPHGIWVLDHAPR